METLSDDSLESNSIKMKQALIIRECIDCFSERLILLNKEETRELRLDGVIRNIKSKLMEAM